MNTVTAELILSPEAIPVISKQSAVAFHKQVVAQYLETGNDKDLERYAELLSFIGKVGEESKKDSQFLDLMREVITKNGKAYTTEHNTKLELVETGTKYDFSKCGDPVLEELELAAEEAAEALKARKDFLKTVHPKGMDFITKDGQVVNLYPPSKTSTSSFKTTLSR